MPCASFALFNTLTAGVLFPDLHPRVALIRTAYFIASRLCGILLISPTQNIINVPFVPDRPSDLNRGISVQAWGAGQARGRQKAGEQCIPELGGTIGEQNIK